MQTKQREMGTSVDPTAERQRNTPRAIPEILAVHFEELASLWAIRQEHVRGPDWTFEDLTAWDARMMAHVEGLLSAGEEALPIIEEHLAGEDPAPAYAAALVLLRMRTGSAADRLMLALADAQGPQLSALADALSAGPIDAIEARLREVASAGSPPQSLVACLALAAHGRLDPKFAPGEDAFQSEDPHVRQMAWRCVAQSPART